MDEIATQKFVKEAVSQFVELWEDIPEAQLIKRDSNHFLIVKPTSLIKELNDAIPYATIHINLEELSRHFLKSGSIGEPSIDKRYIAKLQIHDMLRTAELAPSVFSYFLNFLEILTLREGLESLLGSLSEDSKTKLAEVAERLFQVMLQHYKLLKETKPGASSVITDFEALEVFRKSRNRVLSKRQLAKEMQTTPATVRSWLHRKGFKSSEELLDDLLKRIHTLIDNAREGEK
jgi:hypothetical protein